MKQPGDCRHWRKIRPAKKTSVPNWHAYLSTATASVENTGVHNAGHTEAIEVALCLVRHRGIHSSVLDDELYLPENVWHDEVTKRWPKTSTIWIWSLNLARDLTLSYWWDLHASGRFSLSHNSMRMGKPDEIANVMCSVKHGYAVLSDPPTILSGWLDGHKVMIVDVRNWFDCSLDELAKMVAGDRAIFLLSEMQSAYPDKALRAKQELTERASLAIMDTVRLNDGGKLRPTISSQGWEAWRRRLTPDVPTVHGNADALIMERDSLYGGLVDARFVGVVSPGTDFLEVESAYRGKDIRGHVQGPIYRVDVKSLYPSMMKNHPFPLRLSTHEKGNVSIGRLERDGGYHSIARVKVDSSRRRLPVRTKTGVQHATGRFVTTLAGPDLIEACKAGCIESVGELAIYDMGYPFTRFVDDWWHIRHTATERNKPDQAYLAKRLMNGLFGKCAQRSSRWEPSPGTTYIKPWGQWSDIDAESGKVTLFRKLGGDVQKQSQPRWVGTIYDAWEDGKVGPKDIASIEAPLSLPSIAAFVTAYARQEMWRLITVAGERNVLMCHTDCLWVTQAGLDALQMGGEILEGSLGKLRIVDSADSAEIRSICDYRYGHRTVMSGIPFDSHLGPHGTLTVRQDQSLHEILLTGQTGFISWKDIVQSRPIGQVPGTVGPDGWVTPPVLGVQ